MAMEFPRLPTRDRAGRIIRAYQDWRMESKHNQRKPVDIHHQTCPLNANYPYKPIEASTQVRILEVAPCSINGPLVGRLLVTDLENAPPYEALSHHWGPRVAGGIIYCDGYDLNVTTSIAAALRRLRLTKAARLLWIDSICINQGDYLEKHAQVRIMRDIYQRAEGTLIWLGEEDESTADAFSIAKEVHLLADGIYGKYGLVPNFDQLREAGFFKCKDGDWSSLGKLACRGWFRRTWVLQEVGVAKKVTVHCGSHTCDWSSITYVACTLWYGYGLDHVSAPELSIAAKIRRIVKIEQRTLWDLLNLTNDHEASDPRDRVFALLGLASDGQDFSHLVDYNIEVATLFHEVFKHYMLKSFVGMLNSARSGPQRTEKALPCWLPDWPQHRLVSIITSNCYHDPLRLTNDMNTMSISLDGRVLTIGGFVIDRIEKVRAPLKPDNPFFPRQWRAWKTLAMKATAYPSAAEAFERTLVLGNLLAPAATFASASDFLDTFTTDFVDRLHVRRPPAREPRASVRALAEAGHQRSVELLQYSSMIAIICAQRSLFRSHRGHIGLGSAFLRPGDLLVELERGLTPYVIRPANGTYRFIGEAYMHGWMDRPVSSKGYQVQKFHLV